MHHQHHGPLTVTSLTELLEHAEHLLPSQRPLERFVHHNTLHAFEHLPFEEAVLEAAQVFGAQPYLSEVEFRDAWQQGRIQALDLAKVLARHQPAEPLLARDGAIDTREAVRRLMLSLPAPDGGASLQWRLSETDLLERLPPALPREALERYLSYGEPTSILRALWNSARALAPIEPPPHDDLARPRDLALAATGDDPDALVHPTLIRWMAAWTDRGHAYWPMMDREEGLLVAMLKHLSQHTPSPRAWMAPLRRRARDLLSAPVNAAQVALDAIARMGWRGDAEALITSSLLALPGWPALSVQIKLRPDLAPSAPEPFALMDFLALRLLMDEAAARHLLRCPEGALPTVKQASQQRATADDPAWTLFHAALLLGISPDELNSLSASALQQLRDLLTPAAALRRRALWHLAFERRYRVQILDAILAHNARRPRPVTPQAQLIACIDDREESLRRHLEELNPAWETLGTAGFFGLPIAFRGLGRPDAVPLCPAPIRPVHLVQETPAPQEQQQWEQRQRRGALLGRAWESLSVGSETLLRGGLVSLGGWGAVVPMATQLLAPQLFKKITASQAGPRTCLKIERPEGDPADANGMFHGFTPTEMADAVSRVLEELGLWGRLAPLVMVMGHGSSSLNNPHKAAYNCGACGGGEGAPNARAFAMMANHPAVRALLAQRGRLISDDTWFVGAYHQTASDEITFFDLDALPASHAPRLQALRADLEVARRRDAHERCRRFLSAPLDMGPEEALQHVETRVEDLAQPRPEYGHTTNALALVGRRAWSRGLFLDRRAFLVSYDPDADPDGAVLERILAAVGPVGAGINLEYYFSRVDSTRYGSGTKLPHNVSGLVGVMDGYSSDLRTGLPWQMVEIHEPLRLLHVIEASPARLAQILERQPGLRRLIEGQWVLVAAYDAEQNQLWFYKPGGFVPYEPQSAQLPIVDRSVDWYQGRRDNLWPASVRAGATAGSL